ncbi:MAG: tetraacyldisaccharide 4'-kinase [Thiomicrorhabdus sp.]|nr:MAG: tetraacyldisaccharide 4'-kinase [Thiomicrorhabdus sp.]
MSWPAFWTKKNWKTYALLPLAKVVCWEATRRLKNFRALPPEKQTVAKVIIVGNLVVGGSGKTPFIIWLTEQLQAKGLSVGIISRGYGGIAKEWPLLVTQDSDPLQVGDEPVLLAKQLGCPIAVSPNRPEAITLLNKHNALDVIISDDGLQHYALARDIEIVMFDAQREFGNGYCMPAGPLREPISRLSSVDICIWNGLEGDQPLPISKTVQPSQYRMSLIPLRFRQVMNPDNIIEVEDIHDSQRSFSAEPMNAIAGIGNPARFFQTLEDLTLKITPHAFADHHNYQLEDFKLFEDQKRLLMTEKDAVKCVQLAKQHQKANWWYLEVAPRCEEALIVQLLGLLNRDN